jgi:hypothetical protein
MCEEPVAGYCGESGSSADSECCGDRAMTAVKPRQRSEALLLPPLDPAVIKLIDALARAQAKEDHARDNSSQLDEPPLR